MHGRRVQACENQRNQRAVAVESDRSGNRAGEANSNQTQAGERGSNRGENGENRANNETCMVNDRSMQCENGSVAERNL